MYKRLLEYNKLNDILKSEKQYRNGVISVSEYHRRMVYNSIYDDINMNTFNYINAIFDNLLFRYPTSYEFNECKLMIDDNSTQILMGSSGNCKYDVTTIICNSDEFYEGLVNWSYITFLGREPNVQERDELMNNLITYNDYQRIQRIILVSMNMPILINKMKKLLYLLSLILIISSCRKDDVYELNEVHASSYNANKNKLKSATNLSLYCMQICFKKRFQQMNYSRFLDVYNLLGIRRLS